MIGVFFQKLKLIVRDESLRNRVLFMLGALILFRILATIPIPGVDIARLDQFFANNQFLGLLNIFSGGGLSNLSIVMLGVGPFITASIIMQLMTVLSPKMKAMYQEEGEAGRVKFTQFSRYLTVPLAFMQGFAFLTLLQQNGIVPPLEFAAMMTNVMVIATGSLLLMWLGELITEFGIGNGVSLIIFAGIVATLPSTVSQLIFTFDISQIPLYLGFAVAAVAVVAGVVFITEAERPIPITYARQTRGAKQSGGISTYLPLRVNQAGVIPIIFALSILLFPQVLAAFFVNSAFPIIATIATAITNGLTNQIIYGSLYFAMVFFFTYFYTAMTFDPNRIADNLQKSGAFIPGVRPGSHTSEHVGNILTRITLVGALFLGGIAVLPIVMQGITGITTLTIGGTALLIAVSVVLDIVKRVEAQVSVREY
ncbi:preprotein translocase subunit SecY [Candidatus Kaiserbacteria bacterium]|nr:MAG: preprotein translocase subunit SecY [Candidatus Kaiserbacteria bacterium]